MGYSLDAVGFTLAIITFHTVVGSLVEEEHLVTLLFKFPLFPLPCMALSVINTEVGLPAGRASQGATGGKFADLIGGGAINTEESNSSGHQDFDSHFQASSITFMQSSFIFSLSGASGSLEFK